MAVAYRSSSNTGNDSEQSSRAPAVPAGAAAGDVVVVALTRWNGNPAVTAPAGFTVWPTVFTSGDGEANLRIYWKRLTGSDVGTYTFSWTGELFSHAHAFCMTGVIAAGDPIEAVNGWSGNAGTFGSTSVTTATIPGLIWSTYNDSSGTHTPPTGFTEVIDFDCGSGAYRIGSATGTQTASGGTVTSSSPAIAVLVAVKPAAAGGAVALDGVSSAAAHATGSVSVTRPITGAASAAASVTAALSTTRTVTGSTSAAADHAGTVAVARGMAGVTAATVELTGDLTISGQVTFDGDITAAGHLTGVLSATRPLTGLGTAAVDLAGTLDRRPGFAASSSTAADLSAEVVVGRGLAAAGSATADLTGQLTVTRSLAGVVSMAGDAAGALTTAPLVTRGQSFLLTRTAPAAAPAGNRAAQGTLLDRTVPSSRGGT